MAIVTLIMSVYCWFLVGGQVWWFRCAYSDLSCVSLDSCWVLEFSCF